MVVTSIDEVVGDDSKATKEQLIARLPNDCTKTAGLSKKIGMAVGMTYDICANLDVNDGLANGSNCLIKSIEKKQQNTEDQVLFGCNSMMKKLGMSGDQNTNTFFTRIFCRPGHLSLL
jgi:hypothetical protein